MTASDSVQRVSRLGVSSFECALLIGLLWYLLWLAQSYNMSHMQQYGFNATLDNSVSILSAVVVGAIPLLAIAGVILGVWSLRRKEPGRGPAVAGLVLNAAVLLLGALLIVSNPLPL